MFRFPAAAFDAKGASHGGSRDLVVPSGCPEGRQAVCKVVIPVVDVLVACSFAELGLQRQKKLKGLLTEHERVPLAIVGEGGTGVDRNLGKALRELGDGNHVLLKELVELGVLNPGAAEVVLREDELVRLLRQVPVVIHLN